MVQGGSIFDSSYLVPKSKVSLGFFTALFDKPDVVDLIRQSLQKALTVAFESKNKTGLPDLLQLLKWLAAYSPQTETASMAIFAAFH